MPEAAPERETVALDDLAIGDRVRVAYQSDAHEARTLDDATVTECRESDARHVAVRWVALDVDGEPYQVFRGGAVARRRDGAANQIKGYAATITREVAP